MANDIISLFPQHKIYVEVFGGAGHILFSKNPSDIEIYNDINSDLTTFFNIIRNKEKANELHIQLELTPYSREEFINCSKNLHNEQDTDIERVRKWYVALMQSFSGRFDSWCHTKTVSRRHMPMPVSRWLSNIDDNLPKVVERLQTVQIENLDFRKLIQKYDSEDTLFYLDPPYVSDTRHSTNVYEYEMSNEDHKELVVILLNIKGKVVLSGYDNEIYNLLIKNGWKKVFLGEFKKTCIPAEGSKKDSGQEFVWINFE
jgi:DNA adenine methylase